MVLDIVRHYVPRDGSIWEAFVWNVRGVFRAFGSPKQVLYRCPKQSLVVQM